MIDRALELVTSPDDADRARLLALACMERIVRRRRSRSECGSPRKRWASPAAAATPPRSSTPSSMTHTPVSAPSTLEMRIPSGRPKPARSPTSSRTRRDGSQPTARGGTSQWNRAIWRRSRRNTPGSTESVPPEPLRHGPMGPHVQGGRDADAAAATWRKRKPPPKPRTLGTDSGQPDAMTFFAAQLVDHPAPPGPSPRDGPRHRAGRRRPPEPRLLSICPGARLRPCKGDDGPSAARLPR